MLTLHIGEKVHVRFDPFDYDMGTVFVFADASLKEFVCKAENPEVTGLSRIEVATRAKSLARTRMAELDADLRQSGKVSNREAVEAILSASDEIAGKIVAFLQPTEDFTSQGLRAAQEAIQARQEPAMPVPPSPEELKRELAALESVERKPAAIVIKDSDYWYSLWGAIAAGRSISASDGEWMEWWLVETAAGQGMQFFLEPLQKDQILACLRSAISVGNGQQVAAG